MTDDELSARLNALGAGPPAGALDRLEADVWARIEAQKSLVGAENGWGWRASLAAAMLTFGVFAGSTAAARLAPDLSPFAVELAYAPSTLLAGEK